MNDSESQKSKGDSTEKNTWIAGKKTIQDWEELIGKLDSENDDYWDKAFKFFEIRIKTRYLDPIKRIQKMKRNIGEGFAMVNLQCSLIETIESFYNGWIYQHENEKNENGKIVKHQGYYKRKVEGNPIKMNNQFIFESFLEKRSPFKEKSIDGESFYKNVRCTLLHETQTKNDWLIKAKKKEPGCFYEVNENKKIIYRNNFQSALKDVIQQYKSAIVNENEFGETPVAELRENFLAKFNHICEIL